MARKDEIRRVLEEPVIKEAFENVREFYRDALERTDIEDPDILLDIRKMLHLLREVEHDLQTSIENEEFDQFQLAEQQRGLKDWLWRTKH